MEYHVDLMVWLWQDCQRIISLIKIDSAQMAQLRNGGRDRSWARVRRASPFAGLLAILLLGAGGSLADESSVVQLRIWNGRFLPNELHLAAGLQVRLLVRNDDALPAEFESEDLGREIVVPGHTQVSTYVGPLKPGRYRFFNDFNRAMQGEVVAEDRTK